MAPEYKLIGTQGWRQFLTGRKEMLDAYDRAKTQAELDEVETYHGRAAEAELRKWLQSFLPARFGVTSGYVVSQGQIEGSKLPEFDVIIYDRLESPVLWAKTNPDASRAGEKRALPAEYVCCVLEVKASFNSDSVTQGLDHLSDLGPLLAGVDKRARSSSSSPTLSGPWNRRRPCTASPCRSRGFRGWYR